MSGIIIMIIGALAAALWILNKLSKNKEELDEGVNAFAGGFFFIAGAILLIMVLGFLRNFFD